MGFENLPVLKHQYHNNSRLRAPFSATKAQEAMGSKKLNDVLKISGKIDTNKVRI
jgi:hypothetical protein